MNEIAYNPNECCGRPWNIKPGCKPYAGCGCEYCGCALGRIKKDVAPCKSCCVIPSITTETVDGLTNLANCFVHVTNINTTFYVDDRHRPMIIWAGAVEIDEYDYQNNPLNLRAQDCYSSIGGVFTHIRFDKQGVAHIMGTEA